MPRLRFDGDARGGLKAIADLQAAQDKLAKSAGEAEKKLTAEEKAARRIKEAIDPQLRYNRQIEQTAKLANKGKLSIDEAKAAAMKYGQQLDRARKAGERTFGGVALSQLASYAAGVFSVSAAVGALVAIFRKAEEAAQQASQNVFTSLGDQAELQQLGDDPKKLGQLNAFAKDLVRRGVFLPSQRGEAFKTAIELENADFTAAERESLARVGETGFVKPEGLIQLGGQVRKAQRLFGGEAEAGSFSTVLDKLVAVSTKMQATLSETGGSIPDFAANARAIGLDIDEALAGFAAVEAGAPNVPEAATQFKNILARFDQEGLTVNKDLTETVDTLADQIAKGQSIFEIAPEIRARAGLRSLLQFRPLIDDLEKQSQQSAGLFERRTGLLPGVDPVFGASQLQRRAEGRLAADEEDLLAERQALFDAVRAEASRQALTNFGRFGQAVTEIGGGTANLLGLQDFFIQTAAEEEGFFSDKADQQVLLDYMRRTAEGVERTATQVREVKDRKPVVNRQE